MMNNIGKPCAGKPHARFDEGGLAVMPALYSTIIFFCKGQIKFGHYRDPFYPIIEGIDK
jgi:hypothetical protein